MTAPTLLGAIAAAHPFTDSDRLSQDECARLETALVRMGCCCPHSSIIHARQRTHILDLIDAVIERQSPNMPVWTGAMREMAHNLADDLLCDQPTRSRVFLVATGEMVDGQETYTRHEGAPPPLCDSERLYANAQDGSRTPADFACWLLGSYSGCSINQADMARFLAQYEAE